MPHPLTLPVLSLLAVAGTGVGVLLGRSAISEINPVYFTESEPRFHANLSPYQPSMEAPVHRAGTLSVAELEQGLGSGCVDCRLAPGIYYPVYRQAQNGAATDYAMIDTAPAPTSGLQVETPFDPARAAAEAEHAEALVRVHRYASYNVVEATVADAPQGPAEPAEYAAAEVPAAE